MTNRVKRCRLFSWFVVCRINFKRSQKVKCNTMTFLQQFLPNGILMERSFVKISHSLSQGSSFCCKPACARLLHTWMLSSIAIWVVFNWVFSSALLHFFWEYKSYNHESRRTKTKNINFQWDTFEWVYTYSVTANWTIIIWKKYIR